MFGSRPQVPRLAGVAYSRELMVRTETCCMGEPDTGPFCIPSSSTCCASTSCAEGETCCVDSCCRVVHLSPFFSARKWSNAFSRTQHVTSDKEIQAAALMVQSASKISSATTCPPQNAAIPKRPACTAVHKIYHIAATSHPGGKVATHARQSYQPPHHLQDPAQACPLQLASTA